MAATRSVLLAGLVHLLIELLHLTPQLGLKTPGPVTPTIIVSLALMHIIYNTRIIPQRLNDWPPALKCIFESVTVILIFELSMLFWESIEHTIYLVVKGSLLTTKVISKETYHKQEYVIVGAFTLPLSLAIFAAVAQSYNMYQ
ncbi:uncharacterized protein LOC111602292 [Drosophila hydei]|uniref:Uncharacterized protein LOC111602292 n=1 Tax=Drosophila hydei TaxID=7224 RepID=A0A6J1M2F8_DROHY|nr:uncharacterized protein LOC111602292 [Drosophila hydei]